MGKPRLIILIRHGQSEGNKNREIHQTVPDHRVKLTPEGHRQAQEAGRRLRAMLRPDDTLHFFTSPYRRTRETTEGILTSLTSDDPSPSPFPRNTIKVYEEPRLREQDFGNFQPCSAAMERMWQERADYGHFFYRIPSGESAADAYDRVSGFNESLWRLFGEDDFASVCVLVTHGLMTRIFLMKWYHFSVEYFEDLRNINHCEFVVMKKNKDNGKYILQNQLRTWSELQMQRDLEKQKAKAAREAAFGTDMGSSLSPIVPGSIPIRRQWGGCPDGCNHRSNPNRPKPASSTQQTQYPSPHSQPTSATSSPALAQTSSSDENQSEQTTTLLTHSTKTATVTATTSPTTTSSPQEPEQLTRGLAILHLGGGRDAGGSRSGATSRASFSSSSGGLAADGEDTIATLLSHATAFTERTTSNTASSLSVVTANNAGTGTTTGSNTTQDIEDQSDDKTPRPLSFATFRYSGDINSPGIKAPAPAPDPRGDDAPDHEQNQHAPHAMANSLGDTDDQIDGLMARFSPAYTTATATPSTSVTPLTPAGKSVASSTASVHDEEDYRGVRRVGNSSDDDEDELDEGTRAEVQDIRKREEDVQESVF